MKREEIPSATSFSQCIVEASKLYFTNSYDTVIYATFGGAHPLTYTTMRLLQNDMPWSILMKNVYKPFHGSPRSNNKNNYIIQVSNQKELNDIIDLLRSLSSWNFHAKFIIVAPDVLKNSSAVAEVFIKSLWKMNVFKSAILLPQEQNTSLSGVYFMSLHRQSNRIAPRDYCSFGFFHNSTPWFSEPVGTCVTNCTLKVMYVEWPPYVINTQLGFQPSNYFLSQGLDMNLMNMIVKYLNLTVKYRGDPFWGYIYENGTATGNLKHLLNKDVDVLIGGYFLTIERLAFFDVTCSYMQALLLCCTPDVPILTDFRSMENILSVELWVLVISVLICTSIGIYLSSRRNKSEFTGYSTVSGTLLKNISVILGIAINVLPRSTTARYFMALLIIFGFEVTLFYTGYLTSILSAPKYVQKYNSLEDVYESDLDTYVMPYSESWVLHDNTVTFGVPTDLIKQRWKHCKNSTWCYEKVSISKDSAFYIDDLLTDYMVTTRDYSLNCLKLTSIGSHNSILTRKGSFLYDQFSRITICIFESGIFSKWKKDILKTEKSSGNSNSAKIEYKDLEPLFHFIIAGNAVSFIVFIGEFIYYSIKTRK